VAYPVIITGSLQEGVSVRIVLGRFIA